MSGDNEADDERDMEESKDTVQFQKKHGVEKDGFICFPVESEKEDLVGLEEEEEEEQADYTTCQEDPRFQQQNKTKWCYRMYVDYHSCRYLLGEQAKACDYFFRCYNSICPSGWTEKWDEQREEGKFPCDPTRGCPNLNAKCNEQKPCM